MRQVEQLAEQQVLQLAALALEQLQRLAVLEARLAGLVEE